MQVHNPNPYHGSKGRFTSASAPDVQPVKEKPVNRKHYGKFGKRVKFNDDNTPTAEAYINSALGSTLMHSYSISRFGFTSRDSGQE